MSATALPTRNLLSSPSVLTGEYSRELDDVDKVANLLSEDSVASRILHWKERDSRLKEAATRFRAAKERFSVRF